MDFHFSYQGQCKVTADSYEDAVKQLGLQGIYSYHPIHPTFSMLATPSEVFSDEDEDEDDFILDEFSEMIN